MDELTLARIGLEDQRHAEELMQIARESAGAAAVAEATRAHLTPRQRFDNLMEEVMALGYWDEQYRPSAKMTRAVPVTVPGKGKETKQGYLRLVWSFDHKGPNRLAAQLYLDQRPSEVDSNDKPYYFEEVFADELEPRPEGDAQPNGDAARAPNPIPVSERLDVLRDSYNLYYLSAFTEDIGSDSR